MVLPPPQRQRHPPLCPDRSSALFLLSHEQTQTLPGVQGAESPPGRCRCGVSASQNPETAGTSPLHLAQVSLALGAVLAGGGAPHLRHRKPLWTLPSDSGGRGPTRTCRLSPSSPARVPHSRHTVAAGPPPGTGMPIQQPVPRSSPGGGRSQVKTTLAGDPHLRQQGSAPGSTESSIGKRGRP